MMPGVQVRVDRHLPPGHRIQGESGGDFRDAPRALRDHDEVDDHENREYDHADRVVAADDEFPERRDHVAGSMRARVPVHQHDARRGDVEPEAQQRRAEQHGRERRELQCTPHVHDGEQHDQRQRDVEREEHVEQDRRQRQHHHREHGHDQQRHAEPVARELPEHACRAAHAHDASYSSPTFGSGRATRAATVGLSVRTRKT